MERNRFDFKPYFISPVENFTIFGGFSCLDPSDKDRDLDDFIHNDAEQHFKDKIAVTYGLFSQEDIHTPLAFATLQNDAIVVAKEDEPLPGTDTYTYRSYPAVKIGRFGVRLNVQRKQLGTVFLTMLKRLMCYANRTGCRYITVDARRDKKNKVDARPFYVKNGFVILPCRERTSTYVPMYFDLIRMPAEKDF